MGAAPAAFEAGHTVTQAVNQPSAVAGAHGNQGVKLIRVTNGKFTRLKGTPGVAHNDYRQLRVGFMQVAVDHKDVI